MSIFQCYNGASARILSAKDLLSIPVWKNNRIIDHDHVSEIRREIGDVRFLDHGYHVAHLQEEDAGGNPVIQRYIIDGQHRCQVLRDHFDTVLCAEDFPVMVFERRFTTEGELIEYFNALNKCKPVQPWVDENLVLNQYVHALEEAFDNRRTRFLRSGGCHRPYLSADRVRDTLRAFWKLLPPTAKGATDFAAAVKTWNDEAVRNDTFVLGIRSAAKRAFFEKGAKLGFVLAYDEKYPWVSAGLSGCGASMSRRGVKVVGSAGV